MDILIKVISNNFDFERDFILNCAIVIKKIIMINYIT